jgi:hypothetical protein
MQPIVTNRFPIFAAWCYVIARRLGYSEDEARSLALTRAKLGAAARAGNLGGGEQRKPGPARAGSRGEQPVEEVDQLEFVGMRPFVTDEGRELRGVMRGGDGRQIVAPRQYETSVVRKLADAYPAVLRLLEALAARFTPEELNRRGYHLWEQFAPMVRDQSGRESRPRFGQRGLFDPEKVERLIAEAEDERPREAA